MVGNNDKADIRNYINLSKKGYKKFNDLCNSIRKTFVLSKDPKLIEKLNADGNNKNEKMNLNIIDRTLLNLEHGKNYKNENEEISNVSTNNNLKVLETSNDLENEMIKEFHFRRIIH